MKFYFINQWVWKFGKVKDEQINLKIIYPSIFIVVIFYSFNYFEWIKYSHNELLHKKPTVQMTLRYTTINLYTSYTYIEQLSKIISH